jgi:hypothetical protein
MVIIQEEEIEESPIKPEKMVQMRNNYVGDAEEVEEKEDEQE